jgi:hypothetical protein
MAFENAVRSLRDQGIPVEEAEKNMQIILRVLAENAQAG